MTEFKDRAISFDEQIALLESQGLRIEDRAKALQILQNISYSRLKSYFVPLMEDPYSDKFKPGATFDRAYAIYGFDRRLRELIFHELEKVEISIRARFGYAMSGEEAGFWYTNPEYFSSKSHHAYILRHLTDEVRRSDNDSIQRFYRKYSNPLPPCWLALEASSMGTLSNLYDALRPGSLKDRIAAYYGLTAKTFSSWLNHLVYIRNVCAHHNRLWNKTLVTGAAVDDIPGFPVQGRQPGDVDIPGQKPRQYVYTTLCVIKYLQNRVKPTNSFASRLKNLIDCYPCIDTAQMGFPAEWREAPFWTDKKKD